MRREASADVRTRSDPRLALRPGARAEVHDGGFLRRLVRRPFVQHAPSGVSKRGSARSFAGGDLLVDEMESAAQLVGPCRISTEGFLCKGGEQSATLIAKRLRLEIQGRDLAQCACPCPGRHPADSHRRTRATYSIQRATRDRTLVVSPDRSDEEDERRGRQDEERDGGNHPSEDQGEDPGEEQDAGQEECRSGRDNPVDVTRTPSFVESEPAVGAEPGFAGQPDATGGAGRRGTRRFV
jgi:hypothetical protein